jgi:PRTRC genetic system protein C
MSETKAYQRRRFVYDGKEIPNVPAEMSIEAVRKHLAVYFPELGHATHTEKADNGLLTITFHKQVTSKGSEHALLLELMAGLPEIDHAAVNLYQKLGNGPFTVEMLAEHADEIQAAAAFIQEQIHIPQEILRACAALPPVSAPVVPLGF